MINLASNQHGVGYGAWTHIDGDPLELFQCRPDGDGLIQVQLSSGDPLHVVPADHWQAARSRAVLRNKISFFITVFQ